MLFYGIIWYDEIVQFLHNSSREYFIFRRMQNSGNINNKQILMQELDPICGVVADTHYGFTVLEINKFLKQCNRYKWKLVRVEIS